jgi:hypothetical protein
MNTLKLQSQTATYTTNCECVDYDEQTATESPAQWCQDYCHEDARALCWELLSDWLRINNNPQAVKIAGKNITWERLSGYALVMPQDILNALIINGEFTITLTLDGDKLTARRSSHDEPTGASFTITPASE